MNFIFDPINSMITVSLKDFSYSKIDKYLREMGFFFPIKSNQIVLKDNTEIETFKAQSPLNFIFSIFIKDEFGELKEIGKRILKSSSGYRLAALYIYEQVSQNVEFITIKIYSKEIKEEFGRVKISLSDDDLEILNLL